MLAKLFTWWNSATLGTLLTIRSKGTLVGEDEQGNRYFEEKKAGVHEGRKRRWVVYNGLAEASRVPPDWHGWLHYTFEEPPTTAPLKRRAWEQDHVPNMTGTPLAYRPQGSLARPGATAAPARDYEAWSPEDA